MTGVVPPGWLVQPAQLTRYGVPAPFMAQFQLRPFQIVVEVGGGLGVMQFKWIYAGDTYYSGVIQSVAGSTWAYTLDETFSDLVWASRTYTAGEAYNVDPNGLVTGSSGLAATRYFMPDKGCSGVTDEAMALMLDAVRAPLTTWGDDVVIHAAAMVYAFLKRSKGATPDKAGADGDLNVFSAEHRALDFFRNIGKNGKPASIIDSSSTLDGPLIPAYPFGDDLRGW